MRQYGPAATIAVPFRDIVHLDNRLTPGLQHKLHGDLMQKVRDKEQPPASSTLPPLITPAADHSSLLRPRVSYHYHHASIK
jgi:hypothetical protein